MSEKIGITDVACGALRGMAEGLKTMYDITLQEFPTTAKEPVIIPKLVGFDTDYIVLSYLQHPNSGGNGFIALLLSKEAIKSLIESSGIDNPDEASINASCGELCNLIMGAFRMEMNRMGHKTIDITAPKVYEDGVNTALENVDINEKYNLTVGHEGKGLMEMQIAFQSLKKEESLQS